MQLIYQVSIDIFCRQLWLCSYLVSDSHTQRIAYLVACQFWSNQIAAGKYICQNYQYASSLVRPAVHLLLLFANISVDHIAGKKVTKCMRGPLYCLGQCGHSYF